MFKKAMGVHISSYEDVFQSHTWPAMNIVPFQAGFLSPPVSAMNSSPWAAVDWTWESGQRSTL